MGVQKLVSHATHENHVGGRMDFCMLSSSFEKNLLGMMCKICEIAADGLSASCFSCGEDRKRCHVRSPDCGVSHCVNDGGGGSSYKHDGGPGCC